MGSPDCLLTLEHPGGTAAVVRDETGTWLTDDVSRGAATGLDDHVPRVMGLADDRTLQGGLLPAGAVSAHVTDDAGVTRPAAAGRGGWAIVLDQPCEGHLSPVCFRDAAGELVTPVLPADWARAAVADADEPCPACGCAAGWDEVVASDASRGAIGPEERPAPFVACRACGHEHAGGVSFAAAGEPPSADEAVRWRREADARSRRAAALVLRDVRFAVHAARGLGAARIGGWGTSNGTPSSVTVEHGARPGEPGPSLRIETEHERWAYDSEAARARSTLFGALHDDDDGCPQRSEAGLTVWMHVRDRERLRAAARAVLSERSLPVDGARLRFTTVTAGRRWVAVRRHGELVISVTGYDVDPAEVELVVLADPEETLCSI